LLEVEESNADTRSEHEPGGGKHSNHRKRQPDLHRCANDEPDPSSQADASSANEIAVGRQLAEHRADERPDDQAWKTKEKPSDGTERCSDRSTAAGTETPGAERRRNEIDEVAGGAQDADHDKRAGSDTHETIRPGGYQQAREYQDCSGECRQNNADKADYHERATEHPQKDGHRPNVEG
jgi:hypothetical protein